MDVRLTELVLGDAERAARLCRIEQPELFDRALVALATAHGIPAEADDRPPSRRSDPLRLAAAPPAPWLPAAIVTEADGLAVDWRHLGDTPLRAPFFDGELRRTGARPFNRAFPLRTSLATLMDAFPPDSTPDPDGFVFHMSRCGSTLVAQMLAADPRAIVLAEPPPLDALVAAALTDSAYEPALAAMVRALTRDRGGRAKHRVLKLDCWHMLALPLFRRLFPDTPWVFLMRDPVEVLASHARVPGLHTVPGLVPLAPYGLTPDPALAPHDHGAWLLGRICVAAHLGLTIGGGLAVDYRELPEAVGEYILPHFGIIADAATRSAMDAAAMRDAKAPTDRFVPDAAAKRAEASAAIRAAAAVHLAAPYAALNRASSPR